MKFVIKTLDGKEAGEVTLDKSVFGLPQRDDILHAMVRYQMNKRRAGTHQTKGISDIRGTGKKPFRQKGTGHARAGSLRTSIHRGGATIFGPKSRSHATDLPKKVRKLALKTILSVKAANNKLIVLDDAKSKDHKTKNMAAALKALGVENAVIVCGTEIDTNFERATGNIPCIDVLPSQGANVYDIVRRDILVLTKEAVEQLTERLRG